MAIRLSHALHAVPARKIRKRAFIVIILAGIAIIAMVLVMAPR